MVAPAPMPAESPPASAPEAVSSFSFSSADTFIDIDEVSAFSMRACVVLPI